jgi:protein TonB
MNQISGKVVLSVEVLEDGSVGGITVVSGLGHGLDERAVAAARKGRFLPATRDGKPVTAMVKVEVTFDIY